MLEYVTIKICLSSAIIALLKEKTTKVLIKLELFHIMWHILNSQYNNISTNNIKPSLFDCDCLYNL